MLGRHRGVVHFTVGQRRGIEIGGMAEPLYVIRIEPEQRRIVVGPRRALAVEGMRVADWNWIGEDQREVSVKVRSLASRYRPRATMNGCALPVPSMASLPGQAGVVYDGTRVLGGGWIAETIPVEQSCLNAAAA